MQDYIPRKIDINEKIAAIVIKQFDNMSRFLHVQIADRDLSDGESFNIVECEARLYVEFPEGEPQYIDGEIADGENGIITFLLPNSVTQEAGDYVCEIWLTNAEEKSVISTKPFLLKVEKSIRNDDALEATEKFSALENALLRVAIDKARLNNLEALASKDHVVPGTVQSEMVDLRTDYDGRTYATAGNAVRGQIREIKNSLAALSLTLSAIGTDSEQNGEAAALVADLKAALDNANSLQWQIDEVNREIQVIDEFIPNGSITNAKLCEEAVSANKLAPALKRPSAVVSTGTVAELLKLAESYFNYAYTPNGENGGLIYESGYGLYSDSLGSNAANGQYGIVCSSFVEALLGAISFENSRYNDNGANARLNWGVSFDDTVEFGRTENPTEAEIDNRYLTSQALAKYAAKHGYLYAVDGNGKVRAGDILFSGEVADRYLGIDHVALVINTDETHCTVLEAWPAKKTDLNGTSHNVGLRIRYRVPLSEYTYGAVFPLGSVDNAPKVLESAYDKAGNTESATLIHEFKGEMAQGFYTIVCHGELSGAPYISLKYRGADSNTLQSELHSVGDDHYLTVYVQKPAVISLRMTKDNSYDLSEISLYRGYAEMTAQTVTAVRLEAGDSLNDCIDGVWYCRNAETAKTIENAPLREPTGGFRLESVRMTNAERYRQTLWYVGAPEKMYVRMYVSGGWTSWFVYGGTEVQDG